MTNNFTHEGFSIGDVVTDVYTGIEGVIDAVCVYAHNAAEYRVQLSGKFESYWLTGGRIKHKKQLGLKAASERFVIVDEIDEGGSSGTLSIVTSPTPIEE